MKKIYLIIIFLKNILIVLFVFIHDKSWYFIIIVMEKEKIFELILNLKFWLFLIIIILIIFENLYYQCII